jgi:hypothetical protein
MAKLFPIMIEVEEIALGTVLRKLNEMPGIAKLHLDLGKGGEGNGKKPLEHAAAARGEKNSQKLAGLLAGGPMHIKEITAALGGPRSRGYQAAYELKRQGIAEKGGGPGMYRLKAGATVPAAISRTPSGRLPPGSGNIVLRAVLAEGPKAWSEIRSSAATYGMSPTSINGLIERAKRSGLIRKNGKGYELTAKGQKIETAEVSHG